MLPLGTRPWPQTQILHLSWRDRSVWIAYGGVPFKMLKQFPSDLVKVCFGSSLVPPHPQCSFWHATPLNSQQPARSTTFGQDLLWASHSENHEQKGQNTLVSWTPETIPLCVTYFPESLKSQQLAIFPSVCPCSNREFECWSSDVCNTAQQSMRDRM